MGDFNTQLPHMVIRNRVGFPVSIKKTTYTAASTGSGTEKNGNLHIAQKLACLFVCRSYFPIFSGVFSWGRKTYVNLLGGLTPFSSE